MVKISQIFFTTSEKFSLWQHLVSVLTGPLICFHYYYYTVVFLYRNVDITCNGSYSHKTLSDYLLLNSNQAGWGGAHQNRIIISLEQNVGWASDQAVNLSLSVV